MRKKARGNRGVPVLLAVISVICFAAALGIAGVGLSISVMVIENYEGVGPVNLAAQIAVFWVPPYSLLAWIGRVLWLRSRRGG